MLRVDDTELLRNIVRGCEEQRKEKVAQHLVVVVEEVEWSGGEENSKLLCRNYLNLFFSKKMREEHTL